MKPQMTPWQILLKSYEQNKCFTVAHGQEATCAKCGHATRAGEVVYKDVLTGKHAHITCRQKSAAKGRVAA